jgi:hypothetical protein
VKKNIAKMIFEVARSVVRQTLQNEEAKMMTIGA